MTTTQSPERIALDLIQRIADELLLHPEQLKTWIDEFDGLIHLVPGTRGEAAKLLGSGGKIWEAIMLIAQSLGRRSGVPVTLKLDDAPSNANERYPDVVVRDDWDAPKVLRLVKDITEACIDAPVVVGYKDGTGPNEGKSLVTVQICSDVVGVNLLGMLNEKMAPMFDSIGKQNGRKSLMVRFQKHDGKGQL